MSKRRVTCPGGGRTAMDGVALAKNPKTTCPYCGTRQGISHTGRIRKHMAVREVR